MARNCRENESQYSSKEQLPYDADFLFPADSKPVHDENGETYEKEVIADEFDQPMHACIVISCAGPMKWIRR
jgi:hypothetical protein